MLSPKTESKAPPNSAVWYRQLEGAMSRPNRRMSRVGARFRSSSSNRRKLQINWRAGGGARRKHWLRKNCNPNLPGNEHKTRLVFRFARALTKRAVQDIEMTWTPASVSFSVSDYSDPASHVNGSPPADLVLQWAIPRHTNHELHAWSTSGPSSTGVTTPTPLT